MAMTSLPFVQKIERHLALSHGERESLGVFTQHLRRYETRSDVVKQGERFDRICVLHGGWAMRTKELPDGRRAILNFLLPGDIFCVYCPLLEVTEYSVTALTDATVGAVGLESLTTLFRDRPRLAAAIGWLVAQEDSMALERTGCLSQRTAIERMAHLMLEFHHRLTPIGMVQADCFQMPLTQEHLADALGLSHVHVNRTLRKLREQGLVRIEGTAVRLTDLDGLAKVASFDELYLHRRDIPSTAMVRFARSA